jgi:hypothetical protein
LNSATEDDVDMNSRTAPAVGCHAQRSGLTPAWPRAIPVILKVLLAAATLFLLTSVGGAAAYASPITLPVLFLVARSSRQTAEGLLWAVLAAGSALETGWVLTYLAMGETAPWIWLLPILAAIAAGTIVFGAHAFRRSTG